MVLQNANTPQQAKDKDEKKEMEKEGLEETVR